MEEVIDLYRQLCKKHNIELQECVQKALMGPMLDLSNHTLDVGTCAVLGKLMQLSSKIKKVNFEDCLMKEDSIKSLLLGLCGNCSVISLGLKGNCIQGNTTNALAKMLRHNSTIISLSLNWNNMGWHPESFASFCEALAKNSSIQHVDLRSNHLGSETAAALAQVLMRNCSLISLDLRWNNLGVSGGRLLLESLHHNKTLTWLNLVGNNIDNDIISAVDALTCKNKLASVIENEYIEQTTMMKHQLERQEQYSIQQIQQLENNQAQRELALSKAIQEGEFKTGKLEEHLSSKSLELNALQAKYEVVTSLLHQSQERVATLEERNHSLQEELTSCQGAASSEYKKIKDALDTAKDQHSKKVLSLSSNITLLQEKVNELNIECDSLRKQNFELRETACSLQAEIKGLKVECEEMLSKEHAKHKEILKRTEKQHISEIQKLLADQQQTEAEMKEKLASVETWKSEAQAEAASLQAQLTSERSSSQVQLFSLKKQLKAEHTAVVRGLEEQLCVMEESRSDAEERLRSQVVTNSSLKATNTKLTSKIRTLNNDITELQAKVEGREGEVKAAEEHLRKEFSAQIEELQLECKQISELRNIISEQKRLINDLEHECNLHKREAKLKEEELKKFLEDEARRVAMLHSAFASYFNSSPGASHSKLK